MLKKYLLCRYLTNYWNKRRSQDVEDYSDSKIIQRKMIDCLTISKVMRIHSDSNKNRNNIPIETEIPNKDDISERAKRERRRKIRQKMTNTPCSFQNLTEIHIESSQLNQEKQKLSSIQRISQNQEDAINNDKNNIKQFDTKITKQLVISENKLFQEALPATIPVIDRIVLIARRDIFNPDKIKDLPKSGSFSVMVNGEYMLINIDYEAIKKNMPAIMSVVPIIQYLMVNSFLSDWLTNDISIKLCEDSKKITTFVDKLIKNRIIKLWGIEIAFDFFDVTAEELIETKNFRIPQISRKGIGRPTYYSRDSMKDSLLILYDRKEKLRKEGVKVPFRAITRFEIKYYHTYMRSKSFMFNLSNWQNMVPIILAVDNRTQIARAIAHVFKRKNPFKKMQNYIAQNYIAAIDTMNFLKWLLAYAFPEI